MLNETTNKDVIDIYVNKKFPTDKKDEWGTDNLKIKREENGWSLINYYTPLCYFMNDIDIFFIDTKKYSSTTSKLQYQILSKLEKYTHIAVGELNDIINNSFGNVKNKIIVMIFEKYQ